VLMLESDRMINTMLFALKYQRSDNG
jgi:hypothetical protein